MKHRIAIYSNGYNGTITLKAIEGIKRYAAEGDLDVHFYISFAANNRSAVTNKGQLNIYNLAKLDEYDGLIVESSIDGLYQGIKRLIDDKELYKTIIDNLNAETFSNDEEVAKALKVIMG